MKLTNIEKETIITYNVAESTAEIYTHDTKLIGKIKKMASQYPELYIIKTVNQHGGVSCVMPKSLLTVSLRSPLSQKEIERRKARGLLNGDLSNIRQIKQKNKN